MESMINRKQLLKELCQFDPMATINLIIYQKGLLVSFRLYNFEAIKLVQMLPNKTTSYDFQKMS